GLGGETGVRALVGLDQRLLRVHVEIGGFVAEHLLIGSCGDGAQAEGPSSKHKQRRSNPSRQRRESERHGSDCDTFLLDEEEETSFVRPSSLLDGEERILGCFESNCHVQFGWMQGYRVCARCKHHFCYRHCRYRRRRPQQPTTPSSDPKATAAPPPPHDGAVEDLLCLRCARLEPQTLGHVRDHSTGYASLRNEIRSLARMRDDVTLMKLRQLSKDQHDTAQRRKKRQERMQQRADAGEVKAIESALGTVTSSVSPLIKWSSSAISEWAYAPADTICSFCARPFGYLSIDKYVCKLCDRAACEECCKYAVSLARSTVNRTAPLATEGSVRCCKQCSQVIRRREEVLHFQQKLRECEEHPLKLLYDGIASMKGSIDAALVQYFDLISSVDIMEGFAVVDELDGVWPHQRDDAAAEADEDLIDRDDVAIEWNEGDDDNDEDDDDDDNEERARRKTKSKKTKTKKSEGKAKKKAKPENEEDDEMRHLSAEQIAKRDELKKALLALLVEYQRRVSELVAYKCRSAKELLLVREVRVALWEHKNECLLPFQKTLPAPVTRSEGDHEEESDDFDEGED
ncbi:uncharacterized protein ACA1_054970, partial [Acanthamoeba castellanii str. Neff]